MTHRITLTFDSALHLEDNLMYEHHTLGDTTFDLKVNVGLCDLYFIAQWFWLILPTLFDA